MKYSEVTGLLNEAGLSPEALADKISVSNSTYRRWLKAPREKKFPKEYEPNVAAGVYKLLNDKSLSYDSKRVNGFLEGHLPEFFQAAAGRFTTPEEFFSPHSTHEETVTTMLSNLGNSARIRDQVDNSSSKIQTFLKWGAAWKYRILLMRKVIASKHLTLVDRLVAYGALFYLILPFDLIPDSIPVFGYVDDFGMLGFAAAYYGKRFPAMAGEPAAGVRNG